MNKVEQLMKRCQIGAGGKNALNDAHDILADCYGTLGQLDARLQIATEALRYYENRSPAHGSRNTAAVALDAIEATTEKDQAEIDEIKVAAEALCRMSNELFDRWHSPKWKEAEHTGEFISRLKAASENLESILKCHSKTGESCQNGGRKTGFASGKYRSKP